MKCSHTGHPLPHRLLLLLKPGNKTSREVFPPLQYPTGIITSTHNFGGLSPPREYYHLSPCGFRIVTSICRDKWPAVHIWSTSSLTPFPHNNSGLVNCFYLKGYGLGAFTMISPRKTVLSKNSFPLLHYKSHAVKAEKQKKKENIWPSSFTMILRRKTAKEKRSFLCFITSRVQWKHRREKNWKIWLRSFTMIHLDKTVLNKRGLFICVACSERNRSKKIQIITRIGKDNTRFILTMNFSI